MSFFAIITFLLTGLIFFLTQLNVPSRQAAAFREDALSVETMTTDRSSEEPLLKLLPADSRSRDS